MVLLYALHDRSVDEFIEFFGTKEAAETTLNEILADEPRWRELLDVKAVQLEVSPN